MAPNTVLAYGRAKPFRAFRIVLNSGRSYDVRHPELIRVGLDHFVLFFAKDPEGPHERFETASLVVVDHIEHIETPAAADAAGNVRGIITLGGQGSGRKPRRPTINPGS
jgi:hypothetical protein